MRKTNTTPSHLCFLQKSTMGTSKATCSTRKRERKGFRHNKPKRDDEVGPQYYGLPQNALCTAMNGQVSDVCRFDKHAV